MNSFLGPYAVSGAPSAGTDEVQSVTRDATVDGGTFRLGFRGAPTSALAWDISAANLQVALRAVNQVGGPYLTVTGDGSVATPWVVTFIDALGKRVQPLLTVVANACTAEDEPVEEAITVAETTPGVTATLIGIPKGALVINTSDGTLYQMTGTPAAPAFTAR